MEDVAVVGAGPAGLRCASLCERAGLDVVVLERKKEIGLPVQCSGLVSKNLDSLVKVPGKCIEHGVKGAVVHGPGGRDIRLGKKGVAAYVIDRCAFDRFLASRVKSEIRLGTDVKGLIPGRGCIRLRTCGGEIRARAVLGCDGPSSVVARHFGSRPVEMLQGLIEIEEKPDRSDVVELWLDRKLCDGFLWRIPRGGSVEYGIMGSKVYFGTVERFFKLPDKPERRAGMIPTGPGRTYFERALLVGDAAAQTKPWSGGGVIYGLKAAGYATETLKKAFGTGDFSEEAMRSYEEAWKAELGRPIQMGMMARQLYKDMGNRELGAMLDKLSCMDLNDLDMDFPLMGF